MQVANDPVEMVEIELGSERACELATFFETAHCAVMHDYLRQWEEGPCEAQEMADRMDGGIMAAEANLRAAILMAASAMSVDPVGLFQLSASRLLNTILADGMSEGQSIQ